MEKMEIVKKYIERIVNAPMNLVGYKDVEEAFAYLYSDSVLPIKDEDLGELFLDVGSGGGVPGVFLSIEFDKRALLIDSICKKIDFVKKTCTELGINSVEAMCTRAEELKDVGDYFERFDAATARAVSKVPTVLELAAPYVRIGGKILLYKGPGYNEELGRSISAMKELGVKLFETRTYSIHGKSRYLIVFEKVSPTPKKYPRKSGIPEKKPIR
ncbi:MAG TPA: 16S rRNA (guanine(527)-N(7))-methyltransferase RsmG [Fervidobacterium sp.]|nr:16S rRNA (guanine(527)-N(7))-methyltransferase RsmG [Fervidobacterium sp.]HOK87790.1 16S rRNA (guanine(527)-N(7))-methyltransferase RsmG [Fervidobacterium sp.]HOM74132.1 16S rRNA (guanine(527)-N(7))-methyltransferase RsmG [Fervidobacterium sp.]HPP17783.1 16S rRNA (guanine(527)-N(7))-methyltransferase RsmG [Fervidobacterium sp.]HRD20039.1 16S rRNA (guanine(527)-N(7))-methyltransferase RsmG [Fervidobacterium sp.]